MMRTCRACHNEIESGRFCPDCARSLALGILSLMKEKKDVPRMERPSNVSSAMTGKMHYFQREHRLSAFV